jgi:hypothetical protein
MPKLLNWKDFIENGGVLPAILAVGLALSCAAFWESGRSDRRDTRSQFEHIAEVRAGGIQTRFNAAAGVVQALGFYAASQSSLGETEFERISNVARGDGPVERLAWAARSADGAHAPVSLESPKAGAASWTGVDLLVDPRFSPLAGEARDGGGAVAVPIEDAGGPVYLVVWPVYDRWPVPSGVEERRGALLGFMSARIPLDALLRFSFANSNRVMADIRFYVDHPQGDPYGVPLAMVHFGAGEVELPGTGPPAEPSGFRTWREFRLFGRTWTLVWDFPPDPAGGPPGAGRWVVLALGLALTAVSR